MRIVECIAPTRVDLAGGTLDLWPICHQVPEPATVNIGVSANSRCKITQNTDNAFRVISHDLNQDITGSYAEICQNKSLKLFQILLQEFWSETRSGLTIETEATSPPGAGLGGSSVMAVCILKCLLRLKKLSGEAVDESDDYIATAVRDLEARLINIPTGVQDAWGALRGRVNIITYPLGSPKVETLSESLVKGIGERMLLCYTGVSRASADNNWQIFKQLFNGVQTVKNHLADISHLAHATSQALMSGNLDQTLELSSKEWEIRKLLWPEIVTDITEKLDGIARTNGASFTRLCGAGGGGVMAVFFSSDINRKKLAESLTAAGGTVLDADVASAGAKVTVSDA